VLVTLTVEEGQRVQAGQQPGTIEAMKMESAIRALHDGCIERLAVRSGTNVEPGDLLVAIAS